MFEYQKNTNFETRRAESSKVISKYPDKIPVIVERMKNCENISKIDKNKFLVPSELTVGQFIFVIRKRIKLTPEQGIFIFVNGTTLPSTSSLMSNLYKEYKSDCGFLYVSYSGESTFG